jgi:hypothetical protein
MRIILFNIFVILKLFQRFKSNSKKFYSSSFNVKLIIFMKIKLIYLKFNYN